MQTQRTPEKLLTTTEAAEFLSVKPSILTNWRCTRRVKIPYLRIGHAVRYSISDLVAWLNNQRQEG